MWDGVAGPARCEPSGRGRRRLCACGVFTHAASPVRISAKQHTQQREVAHFNITRARHARRQTMAARLRVRWPRGGACCETASAGGADRPQLMALSSRRRVHRRPSREHTNKRSAPGCPSAEARDAGQDLARHTMSVVPAEDRRSQSPSGARAGCVGARCRQAAEERRRGEERSARGIGRMPPVNVPHLKLASPPLLYAKAVQPGRALHAWPTQVLGPRWCSASAHAEHAETTRAARRLSGRPRRSGARAYVRAHARVSVRVREWGQGSYRSALCDADACVRPCNARPGQRAADRRVPAPM